MAIQIKCKLIKDALNKNIEMCPYKDYQRECECCPRYNTCYPRAIVADHFGVSLSPSVIITMNKFLNQNSRHGKSVWLKIDSIKGLETKRFRTIKEELNKTFPMSETI